MSFPAPAAFLLAALLSSGDEQGGTSVPDPDPEMLPRFLAARYRGLEAARPPAPSDLSTFRARRSEVLGRHAAALGVPLEHAASPVAFRTAGVLAREGYEVRKVAFESAPGVEVPALLYFPDRREGRLPAVLAVHGHWQDAKAAEPVQLRNVFLAKRGYVVLALDAIGAGERSYRDPRKGPITYHGRQLGYGVLPSGITLAGLQIEDNRRALDLLASLPEVDPQRIGVTGASGGGNQTFHLTVLDPRVRAAVAVCFYGAFRGYLEGAHCACELVPGVLQYAEEGDLAGTIAPRPFLVIAAQRDKGAAFRIEDARKSHARAQAWYAAAGAPGAVRLLEFDCDHDYNRDMREAMVAFFDRELRGIDSGDRVSEPTLKTESVDELRVLKPTPASFSPRGPSTVPAIVRGRTPRPPAMDSLAARARLTAALRLPASLPPPLFQWKSSEGGTRVCDILTEPGISVRLRETPLSGKEARRVLVVLAGLTGGAGGRYRSEGALKDLPAGVLLVEAFLRGTGPSTWPAAACVDCPDYLLAQATGVLGTPILHMWVLDALSAVEHLKGRFPGLPVALYGEGVMGTVAALAAASSERVDGAGTLDSLDTYLWPERFDDRWPLSLFAPRLLQADDLPAIAALVVAPRTLVIGSPRDGGGSIVAGRTAEGPRAVIDRLLASP